MGIGGKGIDVLCVAGLGSGRQAGSERKTGCFWLSHPSKLYVAHL